MIAEPIAQLKEQLVTGEMLLAMDDIGRVELVAGRIVEKMPTGRPHGRIELNIGAALHIYNKQYDYGEAYAGEVGVYTSRNPDTVRGMDAALISHERLQKAKESGYLTFAPELVVEVPSPNDSWTDVHRKLRKHFALDTKMVWLVDAEDRQIYIYRSLTNLKIFLAGETLTCGDVLPQFAVAVDDILG